MSMVIDAAAPDSEMWGGRGDSPKFPAFEHEQFFALRTEGRCGQCMKGGCWYPMSSKKWIWSLRAKSAAPMLWTGASPQRCWNGGVDAASRFATCVTKSGMIDGI